MRFSTLIGVAVATAAFSTANADDLLEIYKLAQTKDPIILQQKALRDSAYAAIDIADAANLPQINLKGVAQYNKTNKNDQATAFIAGGTLSLQQSIWRHSNFLQSSIAEKNATSADLAYNNAKQELIVRTSKAYFSVLEAKDLLEFSQANLKALEQQYNEANQRFKVGLIANTDVQEAKASYDQASANVIIANNKLKNSYENLRQITGLLHANLSHLNIETFSTKELTENADYWLKTAEENNLSLQQSMINKEIAKNKITLAKSGHEPTLDLFGSLNSTHTDYKENNITKVDGTLNTATVGIELNIPLYSGGATSAEVEKSQQDYIAASEALELTHRTVKTNLYNQFNNINATIGTVNAYKQSVISAESALKATEAGYQVGTRTIVDVLDATQRLYNAKSSLATARYQYILSWLNLRYTAGILTEADITSINDALIK